MRPPGTHSELPDRTRPLRRHHQVHPVRAAPPAARCSGTGQLLRPAAIVNAHRFIFDSRDEGAAERLDILRVDGVWRCRTTFNCTEACPRGIEVTKDDPGSQARVDVRALTDGAGGRPGNSRPGRLWCSWGQTGVRDDARADASRSGRAVWWRPSVVCRESLPAANAEPRKVTVAVYDLTPFVMTRAHTRGRLHCRPTGPDSQAQRLVSPTSTAAAVCRVCWTPCPRGEPTAATNISITADRGEVPGLRTADPRRTSDRRAPGTTERTQPGLVDSSDSCSPRRCCSGSWPR